MVSCGSPVMVQPPLIDRTALMGGGVRLGSAASVSGVVPHLGHVRRRE